MRRRLAATAATAAIAVGGGVGTAPAQSSPLRGGKSPTTRIAGSERTNGADDMATIARGELVRHRRQLARRLAPHLRGADADRIESALAARPDELAGRIGVSEADVDAAFEAMSRRALERRQAGPQRT